MQESKFFSVLWGRRSPNSFTSFKEAFHDVTGRLYEDKTETPGFRITTSGITLVRDNEETYFIDLWWLRELWFTYGLPKKDDVPIFSTEPLLPDLLAYMKQHASPEPTEAQVQEMLRAHMQNAAS